MFSLQFEATIKSGIGKRLTLLQHLISLAVVESVKSLNNRYENVDLRLKWPNDIYAGPQYKIGGVVVHTSCINNLAQVKSA